MNHVFISYSRKDSDFVHLLEEELCHEGHEVWIDKSSIRGGTKWEPEIEAAIAEAYAFVVVSSLHAQQSKWVEKELQWAIQRERADQVPIIPLLIDQSPQTKSLHQRQAIDFSSTKEGSNVDTIRNYRSAIRKLFDSLESARPLLRFLRELKDMDDSVRENAARKLGNLKEPRAVVDLCNTLADQDADVRYEAALALGKLGVYRAYKPLLRLLNDENPDVCAAAATALGNIGTVEAVTHLESLLSHSDRFVRASVARALGKLQQIGSVSSLVEILRNDPISSVRDAATEALENIGSRQAKRALARIAHSDLLGKEPEKGTAEE